MTPLVKLKETVPVVLVCWVVGVQQRVTMIGGGGGGGSLSHSPV